jgi:anaerobic magnesium-protoporphyrin IX monomethyl ester cyclase
LPSAQFSDVGAVLQADAASASSGVDILLLNPPAPDGGIWIRSQHRVGRRSRENMIWPQVDLAQMAALLVPDYSVEVIDAVTLRIGWPEFERLLEQKRPKYYLTQVTAPTLHNDMYGVFVAKAGGAHTIAFGTHVTPMTMETMKGFPALDFVLRGEPELTLRELLDVLEGRSPSDARVRKMLCETSRPAVSRAGDGPMALADIAGLAWREGSQIKVNSDRPFIPSLDDLPMPMHELLPLEQQRVPMLKGPFTFMVTSRGCPAGCKFCIKHVTYGTGVRLRSPQKILEELLRLSELGVHNVHMYTDLFTVSREQVMGLCDLITEAGLNRRQGSRPALYWTCNSRVDYVDPVMLRRMGEAGCGWISWGIESASEAILKRAHKGYRKEQVPLALTWAHAAGIKNWGYFIVGLPGETEDSIRETIAYAKALPLDLALFHIAAPHPGTPFFYEVINNGWFRPGTKWEEVDMDQSTVLDYPGLPAERLEYWQKRATREWSLRPGPIWTLIRGLNTWAGFKSAVSVGLQTVGFIRS